MKTFILAVFIFFSSFFLIDTAQASWMLGTGGTDEHDCMLRLRNRSPEPVLVDINGQQYALRADMPRYEEVGPVTCRSLNLGYGITHTDDDVRFFRTGTIAHFIVKPTAQIPRGGVEISPSVYVYPAGRF